METKSDNDPHGDVHSGRWTEGTCGGSSHTQMGASALCPLPLHMLPLNVSQKKRVQEKARNSTCPSHSANSEEMSGCLTCYCRDRQNDQLTTVKTHCHLPPSHISSSTDVPWPLTPCVVVNQGVVSWPAPPPTLSTALALPASQNQGGACQDHP